MTQLHITPKYIIVALDGGNLHVLDVKGENGRVVKFGVGPWTLDSTCRLSSRYYNRMEKRTSTK